MTDQDLTHSGLILVRCTYLFIKRDYETILKCNEEVLHGPVDERQFVDAQLAALLQELGNGEVEAPAKWIAQGYPEGFVVDGKLLGIPAEDRRFMKLHYEVLERRDELT
jgi:hypothetical protein